MNPAPPPQPPTWRTPALLALSAGVLALVAWFALRAAALDPALAFIGWLALLFLAATLTLILWSASSPTFRRTLLAYLLLTTTLSIVILCVAARSQTIPAADALRLALLLAAWLALWSAVTTLLRRITSAFSVAATLPLAMLFFAGPVTALPLLRAAPADSPAQRTLAHCIAAMTPILAALDAIKAHLLIEWAQLPQMYHLTAAGQDIPMPLPAWWTSALLYITLALACTGAFCMRRLKPRKSPAPNGASANSQG
jgi:hypothetical protein